jgi:hypothetical protein
MTSSGSAYGRFRPALDNFNLLTARAVAELIERARRDEIGRRRGSFHG